MYTAADAIAKLDTLGSARQIADYLTENGYYGWTQKPDQCPVARYVAMETLTTVYVGGLVWACEENRERPDVLPANVADFVREFDYEWYPELLCEDEKAENERKTREQLERAGIPWEWAT